MMRRWMLVLAMLIVGTLCSTGFQAQVETTESLPGSQLRRPVNPKPFDKFRAPVSGTIAFLFSDRGKQMLRASPHPLAPLLLKLAGEQSTVTGVAPSAGTLPGTPDVLPSYRPRQTGVPQGIMPSLSPNTVNSGCGTSIGTRFNLEPALGTVGDPIALPQNEETIDALVGRGLSGADLVVEGAVDYRGMFGALGGSLTGYYVHRTGTTDCAPQFEGGAPSINDPLGNPLFGFGDPVVAIDPTRSTVFQADLRFNGLLPLTPGTTAITVQRTTVLNLNSIAACPNGTHNTDAAARTCWPTGKVLNPLPMMTDFDGITQLLYLNDKPHMTVDGRASGTGAGNVYVTATEFDFLTGTALGLGIPTPSRIWLVSCKNDVSACSAPIIVSGSDTGAQFSHVSVRPDGIVTVSYGDFNPDLSVDIKFVSCNPANAPATPSCSPAVLVTTETNPLLGEHSLSSNDFRVSTYPKHDHRTNGANIETFMVWERCHVNPFITVGFNIYYVCPKSDIRMAESVNGAPFTAPTTPIDSAAKDQFFPWIKTERTTNTVNIAYYTSEIDFFSHRVVVKLAQINPGGVAPESPVVPATILTSQTNDPGADPALGDTFFGDYIGVVGVAGTVNLTAVHRAYVGFTYNISDRYGLYRGNTSHAEQNNHVSRFDY